LALVTTLDTAGAAAREHLSLSMTGVAYASLVDAARVATKQFQDGLEKVSWPANAATDIASLISATQAVIADDQAIASTVVREQHPDPSAVDSTVGADERRLIASSAAVRADLGLPPASPPPP
jgi:hypothetical protein